MLRLTLSVNDLPKSDTIGWCDPYVEVLVNDEHKHTTQVLRSTRDAVWNDFALEDLTTDDILKCIVRDHDRLDADDLQSVKNMCSYIFPSWT